MRRETTRNPKRGLTLIELLVVVGIVAVLAAMGTPHFLQSRTRAKVAVALLCSLLLACSTEPEQKVLTAMQEAKAAERAGDYDRARKNFQRVLNIAPRNPDALYGLGEDAFRRGNLVSALDYLKRALQAEPRHARAHYRIGYLLEKDGEHEMARAHYRAAIGNDPQLADGFLRLAQLEQDRNPVLARDLFRQGLALKPRDAEAFYDYGNLLRNTKHWQEAEQAFRQATDLDPDFHKAWYRLGATRRERDDLPGALEAFDRALALDAENLDYLYKHASVLKDLKRWNESITGFDNVLRLDAAHEEALFKRASCLEKAGRLAEARDAYRLAAERIRSDAQLRDQARERSQTLR